MGDGLASETQSLQGQTQRVVVTVRIGLLYGCAHPWSRPTRVCLIALFSLLLLSSALAQAAQQPSLSEIWQAAWRLETIVGSWQANEMRHADLDRLDPAF